jgi:hypothetical protein
MSAIVRQDRKDQLDDVSFCFGGHGRKVRAAAATAAVLPLYTQRTVIVGTI